MLWDGREMVNRVGTKRWFGVRFSTRGHLSLTVAHPPSMQMTALVRFVVEMVSRSVGQGRRDLGKCDLVSHALPSHSCMEDNPFFSWSGENGSDPSFKKKKGILCVFENENEGNYVLP